MSIVLAALLLLSRGLPASAESFESWSAKADKASKAGQDAAALQDYTKALGLWLDGDDKTLKAKVLAARAALYEKAGRPADAKADLSQALRLSPRRAQYFYRRGHVELALGEREAAITDLYRATALDLNLREAYLDRGLAYARQGDLIFAGEDYRRACALGLKAGCERAATLKARRAAPGKSSAAKDAQFEALAPKKSGPIEIRRGPAPPPQLDLRACRAGLDACVESGLSFGECVAQSRPCGQSKSKDCCPKACLQAFSLHPLARSEAAAFRSVFEDGRCGEP